MVKEDKFIQLLDKVGSRMDSKTTLYTVSCWECVTYKDVPESYHRIGFIELLRGEMDGRGVEYKTVEDAQADIDLHKANHPLHEPHINSAPIVEYLTHTDRHMIRYRVSGDTIRVYSVNGYKVAL